MDRDRNGSRWCSPGHRGGARNWRRRASLALALAPMAMALLLGCPEGGGSGGGGGGGADGAGEGDDYPHYEGSFKVSLLSSHPVPMTPLLVKVEALTPEGKPQTDYPD